ncbi:MAG: NUDIX domain-containing protein [Parcubacteria group bacterium]|nr:NUDIX domain-containing protein [Parcubacteria group bacterium]
MPEEKVLLEATVCFLVSHGIRQGYTLLLARKQKKIGAGKWNGYGGGPKKGESMVDAAIRELYEETGRGVVVEKEDMEKVAVVDCHNRKSDGKTFTCRVHFYFVHEYSGTIKDTDEMKDPTWFPFKSMPWKDMMPADRDWLAPVLEGKKIYAKAYLGPFQGEKIGETEVSIVEDFSAFKE